MRHDVFADEYSGPIGNQTIWWSQTGSNRRPHACKARALPAELWPRNQKTNAQHSIEMVGLGRLELPTSRLSSARSNQLSYKPLTTRSCRRSDCKRSAHQRRPWRVFVREERETKTAKSRQWSSSFWRMMAPDVSKRSERKQASEDECFVP